MKRRTHIEYNLDPAYVSRRVIGLTSSTSVYDDLGHVASKVDYTYDQGGEFLQHQGEPVQHDAMDDAPVGGAYVAEAVAAASALFHAPSGDLADRLAASAHVLPVTVSSLGDAIATTRHVSPA